MCFAPQKPKAVGRTTAFVSPTGLFPRRFRFAFELPCASPLFSISCELFAHFCNARPLFSPLCGLFCQKHGGWGYLAVCVLQSGSLSCTTRRVFLRGYARRPWRENQCHYANKSAATASQVR